MSINISEYYNINKDILKDFLSETAGFHILMGWIKMHYSASEKVKLYSSLS